MEKQKVIQKAYEIGFSEEREVRGCAQCAIAGIQDALGVRNDAVYQAGSALAGGGAECIDGSCGAYSGGLMMISAIFGRRREEALARTGRSTKYDSFRLGRAFHDKFVAEYDSVICGEVHQSLFGRSFNLRNDDEKQLFRDAGAHEDDDKCCAVVGNGARWATEIIVDELESRGLAAEEFKV